jgi:hypothetical protein
MTKSEQTPGTDFSGHNEFSLQPLPVFGAGRGGSDETAKLESENVRLQRLVAELLIENQQLRQRNLVSRRDVVHAGPSATENDNRLDN